MELRNTHPVIFVPGFLGWGPDDPGFGSYWEGLRDAATDVARGITGEPGRVAVAPVGPISSHWDRARELFYQIRGGGRIDYGEHPDHYDTGETRSQHDRFAPGPGRGLFEGWNPHHPVHLVGHSHGACTIRVLQHMLRKESFEGEAPSDGWIRSITTISGVNNGTTLPYAMGVTKSDGRPTSSSGQGLEALIKTVIEAGLNLDDSPPILVKKFLRHGIDFAQNYRWRLEHWGIRRRKFLFFHEDTLSIVRQILKSNLLKGKDNALYDLSLHGMKSWNEKIRESAKTYYLAYATEATHESGSDGCHRAGDDMNPLLNRFADKMGSFDQPIDGIDGFVARDWWPNDGAVSSHSQREPWLGREDDKASTMTFDGHWPDALERGRWHFGRIGGRVSGRDWGVGDRRQGWDHLDIAPFPGTDQMQREQVAFLTTLLRGLWGLPE